MMADACLALHNILPCLGGIAKSTFVLDLASRMTAGWSTLSERPFHGNHHGIASIIDPPSGKTEIYLVGGLGGNSEGKVQVQHISTTSCRKITQT